MKPITQAMHPVARTFARALEGDSSALLDLAGSPDFSQMVHVNRVGPALAVRAHEAGLDSPAAIAWQRELRASATVRLLLESALATVALALGEAGIAWVPLKGMGLPAGVYSHSEERPTSDIDILVAAEDLDAGRETLIRSGWRPLFSGNFGERYLREEGYAWQAVNAQNHVLELHYRLWGSVPEETGDTMLERSRRDPDLGKTGHRLLLSDWFIIAAVHTWLTTPRQFLYWWELHRLAVVGGPALAAEVAEHSRMLGLNLFVGLSAAVAAELWEEESCRQVASKLLPDLGPAERIALMACRRWGPDRLPLGVLHIARLLSCRRSRSGWRAVRRRVWAHPGTVEHTTPPELSWPRRRVLHLCQSLGLKRISRLLARN